VQINQSPIANYTQPTPRRGVSKGVVLLLVLVALIGGFYAGQKYHNFTQYGTFDEEQLDYSSLDEVYNTLRGVYDGEIDKEALITGAKKGMVSGLGDVYTEYFTATEADEYFGDLEGSFEGIGAELTKTNEMLTVSWILDDSPAEKSGLQNGDIIAKVEDEDSIDWTTEYAVSKIRGDAGTTVKLTIIRGTEVKEITITRAKINQPSVRYEIKDDNIGYIRISRFGETDTSELTRKAAKEFTEKGVKGIVLDLRNNGGGYVTAAREVASLWLPAGTTIATEKGKLVSATKITASGTSTLSEIQTVVLVNDYTASASEIVAGALRDNGKATLLGTQTYGKGVVQSVKQLTDGAQLKITSAKWYTPNGTSIDHSGLAPDEELEFDSELYSADQTDNQLQRALELLQQ